jgi:hypothetical protein
MPYFIVAILIQVACIVHVIRTGRNTIWIWVLALFSMIGVLAYVLVEILPELFGGRTARRTMTNVRRTLDPTRDLRQAQKVARLTDSIDAKRRLAEQLFAAGQYPDAIASYRSALSGLYEHDPHLMLGLARAQFASDDPAATRQTLDELIGNNPDFRSIQGHLLYARALEGEGNLEKAAEEYAALVGYDAGAEARYRQAALLRKMGQTELGNELLRKLLDDSELTSRHARQLQKQWLDLAKRDLSAE